jgi:hypothetical protein
VLQAFRLGGSALGCRHTNAPGAFLAYCDTPSFGYYEQGAYYFGLEAEAIERLKQAKVLFLGNSHAQFAFSTDAVEGYFSKQDLPIYLLGFSYGEQGRFPLRIIKKYQLRPQILVIVADPFFNLDAASPVTHELLQSDRSIWKQALLWQDYYVKTIFVKIQPAICKFVPAICKEKYASFYRRRSDGFWIWRTILYPPDQALPFKDPADIQIEASRAERLVPNVSEFMKAAGVAADCVVLTDVPNSAVSHEPFVRELAARIGTTVILPRLPSLTGVDDGHLSWESAQRWSATFVRDLDPIIDRCVGKGPATNRMSRVVQ